MAPSGASPEQDGKRVGANDAQSEVCRANDRKGLLSEGRPVALKV